MLPRQLLYSRSPHKNKKIILDHRSKRERAVTPNREHQILVTIPHNRTCKITYLFLFRIEKQPTRTSTIHRIPSLKQLKSNAYFLQNDALNTPNNSATQNNRSSDFLPSVKNQHADFPCKITKRKQTKALQIISKYNRIFKN